MKYLSYSLIIAISLLACKSSVNRHLFLFTENNRMGFINSEGQVVIAPRFRVANDFSEGLSAARIDGLYGYIDSTGAWVIPPKYDFATNFKEGCAVVFEGRSPHCIDKNGATIIPVHYREIAPFSNGVAVVTTCSGKTGVINKTGKLVIDTAYARCDQEAPNLFVVRTLWEDEKEQMEGVFNHLGRELIKVEAYQDIEYLSEGIFRASKSDTTTDKSGLTNSIIFLLDSSGNVLMEQPYRKGVFSPDGIFYKGILPVNFYNLWPPEEDNVYDTNRMYPGFVNRKGEILLKDTLVTGIIKFSEDRAFIQYKNQDYILVDTDFKRVGNATYKEFVFQTCWDHPDPYPVFLNGYAFVKQDDQHGFGMIDRSGKWVIRPKFEGVESIMEDRLVFSVKAPTAENEYRKLYGIYDLKGRTVLKPVMESYNLLGFEHGLLRAKIEGRPAWVNKKGKIVWQEKKEMQVEDANVDFMGRGYFYVTSEQDPTDLGGFGRSSNAPKLVEGGMPVPKGQLSLRVVDNQTIVIDKRWNGHKVYIANLSDTPAKFKASDSRLYMKVQAKNPAGEWADIEYLPSSFCGNSHHTVTLQPGEYWSLEVPRYNGDFKTKLRIELSRINTEKSGMETDESVLYSNEFDGSVNRSQFWRTEDYVPGNLMDPYMN